MGETRVERERRCGGTGQIAHHRDDPRGPEFNNAPDSTAAGGYYQCPGCPDCQPVPPELLVTSPEGGERPAHGDGWVLSNVLADDKRIAVVLSVCDHSGYPTVSGYYWSGGDSFAFPYDEFVRDWTRMWVDADDATHQLTEAQAEITRLREQTARLLRAIRNTSDVPEHVHRVADYVRTEPGDTPE